MQLKEQIEKAFDEAEDKAEFINTVKRWLHEMSANQNPVDLVLWVPVDMVEQNSYNPNSVAKNEMRLLLHSIDSDGFTQPVVTIYDSDKNTYVVVDGFHRYTVCKTNKEIQARCNGRIPVVVLKKSMADRMASTVRHNRARGKHSIAGMANLVFSMLDEGQTDEEVCHHLGMEADELLRLKHITGFSKLFENVEYRKAWETSKQLRIRQEWEKANPDGKEIKTNPEA